MDDSGNAELGISAGLKSAFSKDFVQKYSLDKIEQWREEERNILSKYEISSEEREKYKELINIAKDNLKAQYKSAGIKLEDKDFPPVFFVPSHNREAINKEIDKELKSSNAGRFALIPFYALIVVSPNNTLIDIAQSIHHEVDHGIGRRAAIAELTDSKFRISGGQIGVNTVSMKGINRGDFFEEAIVTYNEDDFILNSRNPVIENERKKLFSFFATSETMLSSGDYKEIFKLSCVQRKHTKKYKEASNIIEISLEGAKIKGGDKAKSDLINLLRRNRVDPRGRRTLVKTIDGIFGNGTTKQIFHTEFTENEVMALKEKLKEDLKRINEKT